jgi:lysophospholipase L1-like esterase
MRKPCSTAVYVLTLLVFVSIYFAIYWSEKKDESHSESIQKLEERIKYQQKKILSQREKIRALPTIERMYTELAAEIRYVNPVVFTGDSMIHRENWNWLFRNVTKEVQAENLPIIFNRGIGGNKTSDLLRRYEDNILAMNPSAIFIEIGTNDLGYIDISNKKVKVETLIKNYRKIISLTMNHNSDIKLYVISILPIPAGDSLRVTTSIEINEQLNEIANEHNRTIFIDCFYEFFNVKTKTIDTKFSLGSNTAHLNSHGYKKWASILYPYVLKYAETER